jgi:endonuclease-3
LGEKKISELIYPVGFFRQKAKNILRICEKLIQTGDVPDHFDDLVSLPGVGRKTANLVLAIAYNKPSVAVDTHVFRISKRLGWTRGNIPVEVESELKRIFSPPYWNKLNKTLVGFGQTVCKPVKPQCPICPVTSECPSSRV